MKTKLSKKPEKEPSIFWVEFIKWSLAIMFIAIPFAILIPGLYALKADMWIKITAGVVIGGIYLYVFQYFFIESFEPDEVITQYLFGAKPGKTFTGKDRPLDLKFGKILSNDRDSIKERPPVIVEVKDAMTSNPESVEWIKESEKEDKEKFMPDDLHRSTECELIINVLYGIDPEGHVIYNELLGSPEKMVERITAEASSLARSLASTVTSVMILDHKYKEHIRKQFKESIQKFMKNWGVKINDVTIETKVSKEITDAINEASQTEIGKKTAEAKGEITRINANAEKDAAIAKSEGEAVVAENKAKGEANASKILNDQKIENITNLGNLPEPAKKILLVQLSAEVLKDNTKVITDSKSLMGTLEAVADGMEKKGGDNA